MLLAPCSFRKAERARILCPGVKTRLGQSLSAESRGLWNLMLDTAMKHCGGDWRMWKLIILGKKRQNNIECSRFNTVNSRVLLLKISTSDKILNESREAVASFLHRISYFCHMHIFFSSVTQLCENNAFLLSRFDLYQSQICWLNSNNKLFYCFIILQGECAGFHFQLFIRQNWLLKSRGEPNSV